jgi:transcriptional regulator with GAF, ATPase, and Fis domain
MMNASRKTRAQLLLEVEDLGAKLEVAQQHLQEANERLVASEASVGEQLTFERLLTEISAHLVHLPADRIDSNIEDAQRRICELLGLDRSTLWQVSEGKPGTLLLTHLYQSPGSLPTPERMKPGDFFPWMTQKFLDGETVTISKMTDLPPEAGADRESFGLYGTKSGVYVPLSVGEGPVFGLLTFAVLHEERDWPETVVMGFRLLAQLFANALARRQAEQTLTNRLRFEQMVSNLSARFLAIPFDQVDSEIHNALRRIMEFFQVDRCGLLEIREDKAFARITHAAFGPGLEPISGEINVAELYPWSYAELRQGKHINICRVEDYPEEALRDRQSHAGMGIKSALNIPVAVGGRILRTIVITSTREQQTWPEEVIPRLRLLGEIFVNTLERKQADTERRRMEGQLREHLREIEELRQRLEKENIILREEVRLLVEHTDIVGQSLAMKKVLSQAEQVAGTDATVLLLGETGTGKELLARAIHSLSLRKGRPLVTVNCAALSPTLIESELFGREKGAYTGAMTRMIGRVEIADGSTLFLDEIGEIPFDLQSKLLRVLEEGRFERLGSAKPLHVNVRIIAATNRDIAQEVKHGRFRQDLFYRLNVFPIVIPPLRERPEDIPLLVRAVVKEFQKRMGKEIESIPQKTMQALQSYSWPGNVRELRNIIEHAMILSRGKTLDVHVPKRVSSEIDAHGSLEEMERGYIAAVLEKTDWRIAGRGGAAEVLGLKRTTLQAKMKKLGINRSRMVVPK